MPLTVADLAEELSVEEHDRPLPEIPAETVTHLYLALYHSHIPALVQAGAIVYHQPSDLVALAGHEARGLMALRLDSMDESLRGAR